MTNLNVKYFVYILIAISAVFWSILAALGGVELGQATAFFRAFPQVVTADLVCITLFAKWLWKWKLFQGWLVPFPNLNGTWIGSITSSWVNPETGSTIPPIPATIAIKQSFFKISCVVRTDEMRSDSYTEGFRIDPDRQIKQLVYTYSSRPRPSVSDRSAPHDGSVVLDVIESPVKKLMGRYWTERNTTGEMDFEFREKKILDLLPSDLEPHPLQKAGE